MAVRVGIVGLGCMGGVHFSAYQGIPEAAVVAICDINPDRLKDRKPVAGNIEGGAAERAAGQMLTFTNFAKMLRQAELDVVDICTPSDLHAAMARKSLAAGLHVFSEKPVALLPRHAAKAAEAAAKAGKFYQVGHVLRFWPEYLLMKQMLDDGRFGKLRTARFWRQGGQPGWGNDNWFTQTARSGGAVLDLHIHDTDTILWFFGRPSKVSSHGSVTADGGVNYIWTRYHYDSDAVITSDGGWLARGTPFAMGATLAFETATVVYHSASKPTLAVYRADGTKEEPPVIKANGYQEELRYFIQCVAGNAAPTRCTVQDAAATLAVATAEIKSVKAGRAISVKT